MTLTSDECNFLIYRYLLESGFVHSAFSFGHESHIAKSKVAGGDVPPGALISFIQKGLQYTEIECHVNEDGTETVCDEPFSVLTKHQCNVKSKAKLFDPDVPMDEDYGALEISRESIGHLKGHTDVVFICAYNPQGTALISGSQDCSSKLWDNLDEPAAATCATILEKPMSTSGILHAAWSPDGTLFATASVSGDCWIWTSKGLLKHNLVGHQGPITAIRWNPQSSLLLSCSLDNSVIVWIAQTGAIKAHYKSHSAAVLDCDWRNSDVFASSSSDMSIIVHEIGKEVPVKILKAHTGDVNCVKWNPTGTLLASCSDDSTVKIWDMLQSEPVHDMYGHGRDVCSLAWASINYEGRQTPILASASFDCTVRIWS